MSKRKEKKNVRVCGERAALRVLAREACGGVGTAADAALAAGAASAEREEAGASLDGVAAASGVQGGRL